MNTKLTKIIISILAVALIVSVFVGQYALASDPPVFEPTTGLETNVTGKTTSIAATVVLTIRIVTFAIAMVTLLVIAMRYMISAPNDRADIKKHAVPYVIGVLILFGTSGILTIIQKLAKVFDE